MKRTQLLFLILLINIGVYGQIIADHTVVNRYSDIPQFYIDEVKKMWFVLAGESHSQAYRTGLELLEALAPAYAVSVVEDGIPEANTTLNLRASRATWGDVYNSKRWIYGYGEEDWFTSPEAIAQTKSGITYCASHSLTIGAFGFGWCWDDGTSIPDYLAATDEYIEYCELNGYQTKVFFTTGPVDGYSGETAYINHLRWEEIRAHVATGSSYYFFDYADILCYDDDGTPATETWDGHTFPVGTVANVGSDETGGHITNVGAMRLAKAVWWMLARMAGWDGYPVTEWTGAAGNSWDNDGNWSNGVPDGSTDVIIPDVATDPLISAVIEAECHNLEITAGAMLTVESDGTRSGSLIVRGTSSGTVTYKRQMPNDLLYHYISSPVGSASLPSAGFFWKWSEPAGDWGNPVTANTAGVGYTMQAGNSLVSFTGTVITENVPVAATSPYSDCDFPSVAVDEYSERPYADGRNALAGYGGGGWNLLGNPFTSSLNATAFISSNGAAFDQNYRALYVYNGDTYAYIGTELTGWENAEGPFVYTHVQVGQGFFVAARCNTSQFIFAPEMQVHNTTVPYTKSAGNDDRWPGIQLKAVSGSGEASTLVVYNEQMSAGLDPGYDIGQMNSSSGISIYSILASEDIGVNFARQALPLSLAGQVKVAVGIDFPGGGEITFSAKTVPAGNIRFWLEDRVTGSFTDLTTKSYSVTLPVDTYGSGRFFILASANTPTAINKPEAPGDDLRIWVSGERVIISGAVSEGSLCEVFDISGRKLLQQYLADGVMNLIDLPGGVHGVIVARVTDGEKVVSRKVAVL